MGSDKMHLALRIYKARSIVPTSTSSSRTLLAALMFLDSSSTSGLLLLKLLDPLHLLRAGFPWDDFPTGLLDQRYELAVA